MSNTLNPNDTVLCQLNPETVRRGVFVRYVNRRAWPPVEDRERCLVQFRHNSSATLLDSKKVRKE